MSDFGLGDNFGLNFGGIPLSSALGAASAATGAGFPGVAANAVLGAGSGKLDIKPESSFVSQVVGGATSTALRLTEGLGL